MGGSDEEVKINELSIPFIGFRGKRIRGNKKERRSFQFPLLGSQLVSTYSTCS